MSAARDMLCDTARAVFAEASTAGIAPDEDAGFGMLLVSEEDNGFGGDWGDVNAVLQIADVVVPDLPVAELIAGAAYQPAATVSLMAGAIGQALASRLDAVGLDASAADFEIAAAKLRANLAVGVATAIAHQVHGAIGFTEEYDLHRVTVPLMRWRGAHGNDALWAARLAVRLPPLAGAASGKR